MKTVFLSPLSFAFEHERRFDDQMQVLFGGVRKGISYDHNLARAPAMLRA
jgi:hypothetical protein